MRKVIAFVPIVALLACSTPMTSNDPLDGVWTLQSTAQSPLDPRTLTLSQHGTTVDGSGNAMGVDATLSLAVQGSTTGSRVVLTFSFANGGGVTGEYTATLGADGRLSGVVVIQNGPSASHTLTYAKR